MSWIYVKELVMYKWRWQSFPLVIYWFNLFGIHEVPFPLQRKNYRLLHLSHQYCFLLQSWLMANHVESHLITLYQTTICQTFGSFLFNTLFSPSILLLTPIMIDGQSCRITPDYTLSKYNLPNIWFFLVQYIVVHMNVCNLTELDQQIVLDNWESISNYEWLVRDKWE